MPVLDIRKVFHRISLLREIDSSPLRPRPFFSLRAGFMTHQLDVARGRNIVLRWHAMAEQRLEYLTELFESGRWRRFHGEAAFRENIQEARTAVETWGDLLTREALKNNSAIDVSWLGIPRTKLPLVETVREKAQSVPLQPSQMPLESLHDVLVAAEAPTPLSEEVFSSTLGEPVPEHISRLTLDISTIRDRYPLLHNAL